MTRFTTTVLACLALACSRDTLEEEVDAEAHCNNYCDALTECGHTFDHCMDGCLSEKRGVWTGPCKHLRADYTTCLAELSCEELAPYVNVSLDPPPSERACYPEQYEVSYCDSEH